MRIVGPDGAVQRLGYDLLVGSDGSSSVVRGAVAEAVWPRGQTTLDLRLTLDPQVMLAASPDIATALVWHVSVLFAVRHGVAAGWS